MERHHAADDAFTLIELLVCIAILSILSMLSLQAFRIYRVHSYTAIAESAIHSARIALDAGQLDRSSGPPAWVGTWSNRPGPVISWGGERFMPGYNNPENVEITAFYNHWCDQDDFPFCLQQGLMIRNCKGGNFFMWHRWKNGLETMNEWPMVPTC